MRTTRRPRTDSTACGSKYRLGQGEPSHRYRTLLFQILEAVAAATSKATVGWSDFASDPSADLEKLEQAVFEWSRVIANLTAIDGAVVLEKRFGLVGFGAEVSADLSAPHRVWRALDTEGRERSLDDMENVGTRQRAAHRFVGIIRGGSRSSFLTTAAYPSLRIASKRSSSGNNP